MKRLLLPLLITLMLTPVLAAAQPQADSLRHLLRTQPHNPHLLAQMAQAFSTSCPDSALHYAQLATQHKAQGSDIVTLEAARGEALAAQGHIQQALGHFTQAYKTAKIHHLADQQHNQLCSMGICHSRLQQFDQAAKCYDQVIAYATRHHNHQLAFAAYQNYGAMCSRIGRPDDCRTLLLNALKYERAAEPAQRISVYAGLGTILTYNPATFAQAEQYLQRGINLARQAHEPLAEASCLSPLITLLTQQPNRHAEIPALIARANTIVSGLAPGGTERMQLEHAKVNYYFVTRQWAPALQSALMLYHNGPAVSSERDKVMLMVARAYEGTGQAPRACYFYREAYYIADSLHQLNIQQQVADAAARYDAKEKQLKIAQLQKDAAQAEARQWRLGASLAVATLLLIITIAGAIMRHRHQQRKAELEQARRYIDGIETERKRLAQELHDGVCNDLLVAEMQITNTASTAQATQQLNAVRQNIRHISHQLMPPQHRLCHPRPNPLRPGLQAPRNGPHNHHLQRHPRPPQLGRPARRPGPPALPHRARAHHQPHQAHPAAHPHQHHPHPQPRRPPHHAHHRPHRGSCTNPITNRRPVSRRCHRVPHISSPRHRSAFHQRASQGHQRHHHPHHRPPGPAHHHHQLLIYIYTLAELVNKLTS